MKKILMLLILAVVLGIAYANQANAKGIKYVYAGRVGKTFAFRKEVHTIYTAPGYMSTIILPEKALKVFLGNSSAFRSRVYGKEVIIKPVINKYGEQSDLVILTKNLSFAYRIISGTPGRADFIVYVKSPWSGTYVKNAFDRILKKKEKKLEGKYKNKFKKLKILSREIKEDKRFAIRLLLKVNMQKLNQTLTGDNGHFKITLESISRADGYDYIFYKVVNNTDRGYLFVNVNIGGGNKLMRIEKAGLMGKTIKPLSIKTGMIVFKAVSKQYDNISAGFVFSVNRRLKKYDFAIGSYNEGLY
ncbi:MAG: hypothetical protein ACYDDB_01255 [bacterium]